MPNAFKITRGDGRSSAQVILDLVLDAPAGNVYTYAELQTALDSGSDHRHTIAEVQGVAARVYPRLLREQARALHNVRGRGYRLAPAAYHLTLAGDRQSRADAQMLRGLQTLQHVRWDEMDQNQRQAHEGQLLVSGAIYAQMRALERRQSSVEEAIRAVIGIRADAQAKIA